VGLLHGRKLLIHSIRAIHGALLIAVLACGGSDDDAPAAASTDSVAVVSAPPSAAAPDTAVTLVGSLPEGGPMPPAESAGGIPPYPGASVRTARAQSSEMRSFEAYTPDEWTRVIAWFDSQLGPPAWTRLQAEDMVIYEKGDDEAAITVAPWEGERLQPGVAEYMREARTVIGAAFRP
jgi:hypothetical protein